MVTMRYVQKTLHKFMHINSHLKKFKCLPALLNILREGTSRLSFVQHFSLFESFIFKISEAILLIVSCIQLNVLHCGEKSLETYKGDSDHNYAAHYMTVNKSFNLPWTSIRSLMPIFILKESKV